MRMTTKGRYALRASIALARMSVGATPVSIKVISEAEGISPEFLEQIFYKLRKAGLISSIRGPGGGFFFARPLSEILLKDIIEASGEGMELSACASASDSYGAPKGRVEACARSADCVAGTVWRELAAYIDVFLVGMTLEAIVARAEARA